MRAGRCRLVGVKPPEQRGARMTESARTRDGSAAVTLVAGAAGLARAAPGEVTRDDIAGTNALVKRVTPDGKVVVPPALGGLYTITRDRMNFSVFCYRKNGTPVCEATMTGYTPAADKYRETITVRSCNNLDYPGINNPAFLEDAAFGEGEVCLILGRGAEGAGGLDGGYGGDCMSQLGIEC